MEGLHGATNDAADAAAVAELRDLLAAGEFGPALRRAEVEASAAPESDTLQGLRARARIFIGDFEGARRALEIADTLAARRGAPAADRAHYAAWQAFVADQAQAFDRHAVYRAVFNDSRDAGRWLTGREHTLEYFVRAGRYDDELAARKRAGAGRQATAVSALEAMSAAAPGRADVAAAIRAEAHAQDPPLLVLSDSHSRYVEWCVHEGLLPQTAIGVCSVSQANLYGLEMPSRTVRTRPLFREALADMPAETAVVLHIGEVDCRAVYWNLVARVGPFADAFLDKVTANLAGLLDDIARSHPRIVVTAPILPTYRLRPPAGEPLGAEIRELTLSLCARMDELCRARGIPFAGINDRLRWAGATLDNPYFRTAWDVTKLGHHLYPPKVAGFWAEALTAALAEL